MWRVLSLISTLGVLLFFQNCGYVGGSNPDEFLSSLSSFSSTSTPSYAQLSSQIFAPKCLACHRSTAPDLRSYSSLMASGSVVAGNPAASSLYVRIANGSMPAGGPPLSANEIQAVYNWIAAGAPEMGSTPNTIPDAPRNLMGASTSSSTIGLTWTLPAQSLTNIRVYRSTISGGAFSQIASISGTNTSYTDTGLTAATTYYYKVQGSNSVGPSPASNEASVTTMAAAVTTPTAPSALVATVASSTQINLSWNDNSNNETSFKVERAISPSGPFTEIASLGANIKSYSNTGLTASTSYSYRVRAINSAGASTYTSVATATTSATVDPATFTWIQANVLPQCTACHGTALQYAGLNFTTYAGVKAAVVANNANSSPFYTSINSGSMPQGGSKLPAATITNIRNWINNGALNN